MSDWRQYASRGEWQRIDAWRVPRRDRAELFDMLAHMVPSRIHGHGVETFTDFISWYEAEDQPTAHAAGLLESLRAITGQNDHVAGQNFRSAVSLAIEVLTEELGIEYEGMRKTYLYWDRDGIQWQLAGNIGRALEERGHKILWQDGFDKYDAWKEKYSWRSAQSLYTLWKSGAFGVNTPLDHALALLDAYEGYKEDLEEVRRRPQRRRVERVLDATGIAHTAYVIGIHHGALIKKPWDNHALRGRKTHQAAKKAARQTGARHEHLRENRLARMTELIQGGHSISNAASICAREGLGSASAIRAQWYRHRK